MNLFRGKQTLTNVVVIGHVRTSLDTRVEIVDCEGRRVGAGGRNLGVHNHAVEVRIQNFGLLVSSHWELKQERKRERKVLL